MPYLYPPRETIINFSRHIPGHSPQTFLFAGAVLSVLGAVAVGAAVFRIPWLSDPRAQHNALLFGSLSFVTGTFGVALGLVRLQAACRAARAPAAWMRDYPWPRAEIRDGGGKELRKRFAWFVFSLAGLAVLEMTAFGAFEAPLPGELDAWGSVLLARDTFIEAARRRLTSMTHVVPETHLGWVFLLLEGILLGSFIALLWRAARHLRFGSARLIYGAVPYRLGGRLNAVFAGNPALAGAVAEAELRHIHERVAVTQYETKNHYHVVAMQNYSDTKPLDIQPSGRAEIIFDLPAEGPAANLSGDPTAVSYWEIAVRVKRAGQDYVGEFLVPVYGATAE